MKTGHSAGKLLPVLLVLVMVLSLLPAAASAEGEDWGETEYLLKPAGYSGQEKDTLVASRKDRNSGRVETAEGNNIRDIQYVTDLALLCSSGGTATLYADFPPDCSWAAQSGQITAAVPPLGHDFHDEDIIPIMDATYDHDGSGTWECRRCGLNEEVSIPRLKPKRPDTLHVSVQLLCTDDRAHTIKMGCRADSASISEVTLNPDDNVWHIAVKADKQMFLQKFRAEFGGHELTDGPEEIDFRFDSASRSWVQDEEPVYTFSCADYIPIDETTFPDPAFRDYVLLSADTDSSGSLSAEEISAVKKIDVHSDSGGYIQSLQGVEYFTELTELNCGNNMLESLDLSGLTALTLLDCSENLLSSLDMSSNTALEILYCRRNQLNKLDVSRNAKLTGLACSENILPELDVSNNTKLTLLDCSYNMLTSLDVSNLAGLTKLVCSENKLSTLDVSGNTKLTVLYCIKTALTELDVSNNTELKILECRKNKLTELDVSRNTELTELDCGTNSYPKLDVRNNTKLTELDCSNGLLTDLDVSSLTDLNDLDCSGNQLSTLDVSGNKKMTGLDCSKNALTELDAGNNTALKILDCCENKLTKLDVSRNTELTKLDCGKNILPELDVSSNTKLTKLHCSNCLLTDLDVSSLTGLTDLDCRENQLSTLDVSGNTKLRLLSCDSNRLTSLNLSENYDIVGISSTNNSLVIPAEGIDTAELPGFDLSRVISCSGGSFSPDGMFTFDAGCKEASYEYNAGQYFIPVFTLRAQNAAAESGDVNGDGSLDIMDAVSLMKALSGGKPDAGADINGDGSTDIMDLIALMRKISQQE